MAGFTGFGPALSPISRAAPEDMSLMTEAPGETTPTSMAIPPPERGRSATPDPVGGRRLGVNSRPPSSPKAHTDCRTPTRQHLLRNEANAVDPGSSPGQALPLSGGGMECPPCSRAISDTLRQTYAAHCDDDRLREECGVFGIFGHPDAAAVTALGLHALQHRGQEAAGIVTFDGKRFHSERRMGLVGDNFSRREVIERLPGASATGHVRYSTTGETILRNVQPLFCELDGGGFAVGHNGNLTNGLTLRRQLVRDGAIMQSTSDTEVILHLVARSQRNRFIDRFIDGLRQLEGAYSFVALTNKKLIGTRDPLGIRPLVIGDLGGHPILA